jgi:nucleoside-diphosphate-sugar epimerase
LKCTVLGGRGFIGRHLVKHLESLGYSVWAPERDDRSVLIRELGHVYYCIGLTADYLNRPADTIEAHISLLSRILSSNSYESMVYLSSTRLYDGCSPELATNEDSYFNVSPQEPRHFYDLTKLTGESLCFAMGKGKAKSARLSCVYNDHTDDDGFLARLLKSVAGAKRGETLAVSSSPNFSRDYVHLSDVLRAIHHISVQGTDSIYNVASGINVSNTELKKLIKEFSGRDLEFGLDQKQVCPAPINIDRIRNSFGLLPKSVHEIITPWLKELQ